MVETGAPVPAGSSAWHGSCNPQAMWQQLVWPALLWGCISAVSLPLGAYVGIRWRPHSKVVSTSMAFGAGALLFALTVELMAEVPVLTAETGLGALFAGVCGALAGGLLFDVSNKALNDRGAFLRNLSNAKEYVARTKRRRAQRLLSRLTRLEAFADVPPESLADLASHVRRRRLTDGEAVFEPGDAATAIYFVRRGKVQIDEAPDQADGGSPTSRCVESFDSFGELAALTRTAHQASARAVGETVLYVLEADDLKAAADGSPAIREALRQLARDRASDWHYRKPGLDVDTLFDEAEDDLDEMNMPVEEEDFRHERNEIQRIRGVAIAIWLGIAIDAIPESLVIGTLAISAEGMSMAFIIGVFLANFPEAMSSAVSMRIAGMSRLRIMLMWGSLCILTGVGAAAGALLFQSTESESLALIFIEGLAAGAMLTAIAETMLPEAFEQGGSIVGFATLVGFLSALVAASI